MQLNDNHFYAWYAMISIQGIKGYNLFARWNGPSLVEGRLSMVGLTGLHASLVEHFDLSQFSLLASVKEWCMISYRFSITYMYMWTSINTSD